jgi:YggT family protein
VPGAADNSLLITLGQTISFVTWVYVLLIVLRVLLTWVNPNPYSPFMRFLAKAADPALNLGRRLAPLTLGGLDFSPILVIILIQLGGMVLGEWCVQVGLGRPMTVILPLLALNLIRLLDSLAWMLMVIMAARLILSVVYASPYNILVRIIYGLSEPLLAPLRRYFPAGPGGLDLRALVCLVIVLLVRLVLLDSLSRAVVGWML